MRTSWPTGGAQTLTSSVAVWPALFEPVLERDQTEITRSIHLAFSDDDPVKLVADATPSFEAGIDIVVWSWWGALGWSVWGG